MTNNSKDTLVVVLARHYSTGLAIIRSLGAAGYTVDLVANASKRDESLIASKSKYVRNYSEVVAKKIGDDGDRKIVEMLLKYKGQNDSKPVLFPVDDFTASVADKNRDVLSEIFVMPSAGNGTEGEIVRLMDKTVQSRIAREAGLKVPAEWVVPLANELIVPGDMVYPCFCKPIESMMGFKRELVKCSDEKELMDHLTFLKRRYPERSVLIQEFLDIKEEIDLSGVCIDQEIIIPAIIRKTGISLHERGVTMAGRIHPAEELGDAYAKAVSMLKEFHYTGMFDMEFNIVGDDIYFNEVNLRCGGPNYSYFASGVNLPEVSVKALLGEEITEAEKRVEEYGKSFIYEKVAWEDYMYGHITKGRLNELINGADVTLLCNDDDPEPGRLFEKEMQEKAREKIKRRRINSIRPYFRKAKMTALGYPQMKKKNRRDPNAPLPRVLVAGRNYSSNLCLARSIGEAGYEVEVLRIFRKRIKASDFMKKIRPEVYCKYVKAYNICVTHLNNENIVDKLIKIADTDNKMLLIPSDDLMASVIDKYYDELKAYYIMQNAGESGEINRLMNKEYQTGLAAQFGVPVINSHVIKTVNGEFEIPEGIKYPCFVKPNVSVEHSKSIMRKCDSEEELQNHIFAISRRRDREMLVEDYIEIAKEYAVLGLSAGDTVIAPAAFAVEEYGRGERKGIAVSGKTVPVSQLQPLTEKTVEFVRSLNFTGLFDVDVIEDSGGNQYFVELNLRFGASGYVFTKCGVNLPGMYADYVLKGIQPETDCEDRITELHFANERELLENYVNGDIGREKVEDIMKEADVFFIKCDDDPKPYRHMKKFFHMKRFLK